jgi:hypothetical protein
MQGKVSIIALPEKCSYLVCWGMIGGQSSITEKLANLEPSYSSQCYYYKQWLNL